MRDIEKRIINLLEELGKKSGPRLGLSAEQREQWRKDAQELVKLLEELTEESCGKMTLEFLNQAILKKYLKDWERRGNFRDKSLCFRFLIEEYLVSSGNLKEGCFTKIKDRIKELREEIFKSSGQGLLAIDKILIRGVYLSGDKALIELFSKDLPAPKVEVFAGYPIPPSIQEKANEGIKAVLDFLQDRALSSIEPSIIKIQRKFRAARRQKQEKARIAEYPLISGGWDLALMSDLPENGIPKEKTVYLEKPGVKLKFQFFSLIQKEIIRGELFVSTSKEILESIVLDYDKNNLSRDANEIFEALKRASKKGLIPRDIEISKEKEFAEKALAEANTPYRPQRCSEALSKRIFEAAKKIKLFSTVHHLTSENALESIFDDCLYGQKNLRQGYIPFKPASLTSLDLDYGGDANVICFAPKNIDPLSIQEDAIDLVFDLDKLGTNRCIFYKQRDLKYDPRTINSLKIGEDQELLFTHTKELTAQASGRRITEEIQGYTNLQIGELQIGELQIGNFQISNPDPPWSILAYSNLPNYLFIAYDVLNMHQILTLNFFRFLDTLKVSKRKLDEERIASIYAYIEKLDEKQLVEFLTDLGQKMTATAEFNFYGAYKIDFSALQTIYSKKSNYTIDVKNFIKELQFGNQAKLKEAVEKIPNIFKSYRFLDYLLSKVTNHIVRKDLLELKQSAFARAPAWMKELHKTKQLEQKLLKTLEAIRLSQSQPDSKKTIEDKILTIRSIQEKLNITLDYTFSNGKTLEKQIEVSVPQGYRKTVLELFPKAKPKKVKGASLEGAAEIAKPQGSFPEAGEKIPKREDDKEKEKSAPRKPT